MFFCAWTEMDLSWKLFVIIVEGNKVCCENPILFVREMTPSWKIFSIYYIFDKKWPGHKKSFVCMAYSIGYSLISCCYHCTVCSENWLLSDSIRYLVGFLIDIYVHIFILGKKLPRCAQPFYVTSLCTLFISYIYKIDFSLENLCCVCKYKQHHCENSFFQFLFRVWPSGRYLWMLCWLMF